MGLYWVTFNCDANTKYWFTAYHMSTINKKVEEIMKVYFCRKMPIHEIHFERYLDA